MKKVFKAGVLVILVITMLYLASPRAVQVSHVGLAYSAYGYGYQEVK